MWILTESFNDYDQHGEYFRACWSHKPNKEELEKVLGEITEEEFQYLLKGGGRKEVEYSWYYLENKQEGILYED